MEPHELAEAPPGHLPGEVESITPFVFTVRYLPEDSETGVQDGRRISVQVIPPLEQPWVGYAVLAERPVREGKHAILFVVSAHADDPTARRAISWAETDRSRVTIYAGAGTAAEQLVALAELVRKRR